MVVSDAILTRLLQLHPKIIDLSLERMHRLLALLGNPERQLPPVIHVAGTNGKGSTVAFTRAVMEAAGLKVHCYTSPHLVRFHERIRVAGELISEGELSALLEECERVNGGVPITFFEITTAAAFLAFSRNKADYLILEVGLGGRLDATNVIDAPAVTAITSISLDHQQYLGDTIEKIAAEKAGIIKKNRPVVIADMPPEAREVIEGIAEKHNAPAFIANQDWQSHEQHGRMVFQDEHGLLDLPLPSLKGAHQIQNAGNAIAIIRTLKDRRIGDDHIARGISTAEWPARMQKLKPGKLHALTGQGAELWLDGGHNPDAGVVLAQAFAAMMAHDERPLILIWGMLNTKDAASFIAPLAKIATHAFTITIPDEPNAIIAEQLAEAANTGGVSAVACKSLAGAIRKAASVAPQAVILICGSLYLAGHVLAAHEDVAMTAVSGAARR